MPRVAFLSYYYCTIIIIKSYIILYFILYIHFCISPNAACRRLCFQTGDGSGRGQEEAPSAQHRSLAKFSLVKFDLCREAHADTHKHRMQD
jgi:hypothetical protein